MFLLKNNRVSTPDRPQSKKLLTIGECGSKIATTSFFYYHLSPVMRGRAIEYSVYNYFWSTFVDSIDVFNCRLSGVVSLYAS